MKISKMKKEYIDSIKSLTWPELLLLFGIPTVLNFIACRIAIPWLDAQKIFPIEVTYFISVGLLVLVPMFFGAIYLSSWELKSHDLKDILERFRIKKLSKTDLLWTVSGFIVLSFASFLIAKIILPKFQVDANPFFFQNMPLNDDYFWIIYVWSLFFFFNIFGEEFLWRGYIQPRQELLNKKYTWSVHGLLWAVWHLPMGLDLIYSAFPIFFILPAVVQFRKNTTIAIIIHFVFGAFGFLALAFGFVH
jgi:membrane protease YdiL (CAAX protease family)